MANMSPNKTPMAEASAEERRHTFNEVALGYTEAEAMTEATRCLNCRNKPCVSGCPVNVNIPKFIAEIAAGNHRAAYDIIRETNSLPGICGRVCPQENQCEGKCVRGIKGEPVAIGRLERFAADWYTSENGGTSCPAKKPSPDAPRIAVVGSGPAGLTCAGDLLSYGYNVDIFEAFHTPGGVLVYGIPEFRLPKSVVMREIEALCLGGARIFTDMVIGRIKTVDELLAEGYAAVFIGTGAGLPSFLGIPGENSNGVYSANEFLTRINLMRAYRPDMDTPFRPAKRTVVVGGGNVAMDAARCAVRLGSEDVYIVYRRSEKELPARAEEVKHAKEEGVEFKFLTNPVEIKADENGNVTSVVCRRMELGEPDASGRRSPIEIPGSEFEIEADAVVIAIGTTPNPLIKETTPGLASDNRGRIITSDGVTTTHSAVFAGGDAVTGAATVILAMGAGKEAAAKIRDMIESKRTAD